MRLGLAGEHSEFPQKALILSGLGAARLAAERIALEFGVLGIESTILDPNSARLPEPREPGALDRLREVLVEQSQSTLDPAHRYLHPGTSAWADRSELVQIGEELGFSVIAPPARVVNLFGNRLNLLQFADGLGIPHRLLGFDPMTSPRELAPLEAPFLLRAIRGDRRLGSVSIRHVEEVEEKFPLWIEQLRLSLGEILFYAEKPLEAARQLSLPFARFHDGRTHLFPEVDGSLQLKFREAIEFCPAQNVDEAALAKIRQWTVLLAEKSGFVGIGELTFLLDGPQAYLIDGLARLGNSFSLWEKTVGTSAVEWQLATSRLGSSGPLPKGDSSRVCAVLLHVWAENPLLMLPTPGRVDEISDRQEWAFSSGRVEARYSVGVGDLVAEDPLVGTLLASGPNRPAAIDAAVAALDPAGSAFWVAGTLETNERFLSEVLQHPWIKGGFFHGSFLDEEFIPEWIEAPVEFLELVGPLCGPGEWRIGRKKLSSDTSLLNWIGPGVLRLRDGRPMRASASSVASSIREVRIGHWWFRVSAAAPSSPVASLVKGVKILPLRAQASGRVHSLLCRQGGLAAAHQPLVLVESLRQLVPHALPKDVRIVSWAQSPGDLVEVGQELAQFEVLCE